MELEAIDHLLIYSYHAETGGKPTLVCKSLTLHDAYLQSQRHCRAIMEGCPQTAAKSAGHIVVTKTGVASSVE
jgi:hypothetical protein